MFEVTDNGLLFFDMMKSYNNSMDKHEFYITRLDDIDTLNSLKFTTDVSIFRLAKSGTKGIIYYHKTNETYLFDVASKTATKIYLGNDDMISDIELSYDGSKIAYAIMNLNKPEGGEHRYYLYAQNIDGSDKILVSDSALITYSYRRRFHFSKDNSILVYQAGYSSSFDFNLYKYSFGDMVNTKLTSELSGIYHIVLSPDGKKIAFVLDPILDHEKPNQLMILNIESGKLIEAWSKAGSEPILPLWLENSEDLLFISKKDLSIINYNYISGTSKIYFTFSSEDTDRIVDIFYY
ncbi:MAG: hypothetical protein M9949_05880 [Candidatus Kapabacteria bacterium]|nr:hypothetical protein [Candidatus Kapabacteria bacterium]